MLIWAPLRRALHRPSWHSFLLNWPGSFHYPWNQLENLEVYCRIVPPKQQFFCTFFFESPLSFLVSFQFIEFHLLNSLMPGNSSDIFIYIFIWYIQLIYSSDIFIWSIHLIYSIDTFIICYIHLHIHMIYSYDRFICYIHLLYSSDIFIICYIHLHIHMTYSYNRFIWLIRLIYS